MVDGWTLVVIHISYFLTFPLFALHLHDSLDSRAIIFIGQVEQDREIAGFMGDSETQSPKYMGDPEARILLSSLPAVTLTSTTSCPNIAAPFLA